MRLAGAPVDTEINSVDSESGSFEFAHARRVSINNSHGCSSQLVGESARVIHILHNGYECCSSRKKFWREITDGFAKRSPVPVLTGQSTD